MQVNDSAYSFHLKLSAYMLLCVFVRAFPLGPDQVLLRGAMLKNTKWIFGKTIHTIDDSMNTEERSLARALI